MGQKFANQLPSTAKCFTDFLGECKSPVSSFFQPITPAEIRLEILPIPNNKSQGLYSSCPTRVLKCASDPLSHVLAEIFNSSTSLGT